MSEMAPGWQADPTGRFEHRYWDGTQWTDNVSNAGVATTDPFTPAAPEGPAMPAADAPGWGDPTVTQPTAPADPTATWPAPPVPPSAVPPVGPPAAGSNKGLLFGGGILAAVVVAVVAFLLLGGDDDKADLDAKNTTDFSITADTIGDGGYGSDADLDALYDQCEAGDYQACDDLFDASPSGSEYEDFADTCGDRNAPGGHCVDMYEGGGSGGLIDPGTLPEDFEQQIADFYENDLGLSKDQAECLAGKITTAVESGDLTEEQAMSEIFSYLSDCNIDMSDIGGN
jgi:hypothetical protein